MQSQLLEEALKVIPSPQLLVNVVSRRVRQLTAGHRPMIDAGPRMGFADIALSEIIEGKLTFERLAEAPDDQHAAASGAIGVSGSGNDIL
jgi:DNA-directed RNA polymerase subunit omega